jgi:hypothetical protein
MRRKKNLKMHCFRVLVIGRDHQRVVQKMKIKKQRKKGKRKKNRKKKRKRKKNNNNKHNKIQEI